MNINCGIVFVSKRRERTGIRNKLYFGELLGMYLSPDSLGFKVIVQEAKIGRSHSKEYRDVYTTSK
jgi:hypothetical protein